MKRLKCKGLALAASLSLITGDLLGQSHITWKIQLHPQKAAYVPGDTLTLICEAKIASPFHLYSARIPEIEANLPTQLGYDKIQGVQAIGNLQEKGNLLTTYDSVFGTTVYYYEKEATFFQRYMVKKLPAELTGYLRYQYCDEEGCFTEVRNFSYKLREPASQVALMPPAGIDTPSVAPVDTATSKLPTFSVDATTAKVAPQTSKGEIFLMSFLLGLLALATPCTFPMIPLTISYFTKSTTDRRKSLRLSVAYALSIVVIFLIFGVLLSVLMGASGAYHVSTNPILNLFFFVLLVLFGLSFLGLFEITLPSSWVNQFSRRASLEGIGILFMALTLVFAAFSCIGPLLGTLLIQAAGGTVWTPLIGMLGFSLAFALPFGFLAYFPTWLHALPKAGDWMETFKVTLGFLELALSLKFLSNADLVWHLGILDREVYIAAEMVIFTFLGLYLLGKIPLYGHQPASIGVGRLMVSMVSFLFVLYMLPGLWGAPLRLLSGFLPPVHSEIGVRVLSGEYAQSGCDLPPTRRYASILQKHTPAGFCVFYDLQEAQKYAASVNRPLFIDFTGHTCVNCRQVESSVWSDPAVKSLLGQYVMVSLFVDDSTPLTSKEVAPDGTILRTLGDKWLYLQKTQFGVQAQPYYVLADPTLKVLVEPLGFTLDRGRYEGFLKKGLELYHEAYAKNR